MAYLPKLNPTVGGGLGGLPERRATGGAASANSVQRSIIGQAVKGSLAYRNTTTGDTYSLDPVEGLADIREVVLSGITNNSASAVVAMFDDGGYVIAYTNSSSSVSIIIYAADGTQVLGSTVVEAVSAGRNIAIAVNPVTQWFTVLYYQGETSGSLRRALYNRTGTLQGSITTLSAGLSTNNNYGQVAIDFFDDGYSVVHWAPNVNTGPTTLTLYNASYSVVASYSSQAPDQSWYRCSVRCLSSADRTVAFTGSEAGGTASSAGRIYCEVVAFYSNTGRAVRRFLVSDDGGTSIQRTAVAYNDENKQITCFFKSQANHFHMTSSEFYFRGSLDYAPTKEYVLPQCDNTRFSAIDLGGDRFLVTYGGISGSNHTQIGILNSNGEWISPPRILKVNQSDNFYSVYTAKSVSANRCIAVTAVNSNLVINVYSYRNRSTEIATLQGYYPIKLIDYTPVVDPSYPASYSIHATQATNKFVLAWRAANTLHNWAVYSSGGTLLNGPFVNTTIAPTNSTYQFKALYLPNGNICLITNTTSNTIKFAIYNSANVLQGSITTVTTVGQQFVAEVANNGNFIICFGRSTGGVGFNIYDQTGGAVNSGTIASSATDQNYQTILYNTVSDNFLYTCHQTTAVVPYYALITPTGTFTVSFQSVGSIGAQTCNQHATVQHPDGTMSVYGAVDNGAMYIRKLASTGGGVIAWTNSLSYETFGVQNAFQLLPISNTTTLCLSSTNVSSNVLGRLLNIANGYSASVPYSFGVGAAWSELFYKATPPAFPKLAFSFINQIQVTKSLNGDLYIATTWGDVYRLSPDIPNGSYVIDGVINAEAINGTVEVITNGMTTRNGLLPRSRPFIANGSNGKKVIVSDNISFASN